MIKAFVIIGFVILGIADFLLLKGSVDLEKDDVCHNCSMDCEECENK